MIFAGTGGRQSKQVFQLIEDEQHRGAEREADDYGMRNITGQIAQPQQ